MRYDDNGKLNRDDVRAYLKEHNSDEKQLRMEKLQRDIEFWKEYLFDPQWGKMAWHQSAMAKSELYRLTH